MSDALSSTSPVATVVITTKNRKDELLRAIASVRAQSVPLEILIIDDGSTDGTGEVVKRQFPEARVERFDASQGLIRQRNRGADLATCEIVFSIDDDAEFSTPNVVEQTLREFDDPRVGAVAIPFINVNQSKNVYQLAPDGQQIYVTQTFIGTAHALRRKLFRKLGGYHAFLTHQGEESDYTIRMLNAGYVTRMGRADPIFHYESPRRDLTRIHYYGTRNSILFAWYNVPLLALPAHMLATSYNNMRHAFQVHAVWIKFKALFAGYACCFRQFGERKPVSHRAYRLFRQIKMHPHTRLADVEARLPAISATAAE